MTKTLVEMAAGIVQSQCSIKHMSSEEISEALKLTFNALKDLENLGTQGIQTSEETTSELSPAKSIQRNKITCLECGQEFKQLSSKHLQSHGLTGREYRVKYGFSLRQPLCAKALTAKRKKAGKERGIPESLKKAIAARTKTTVTEKAAVPAKKVTAKAKRKKSAGKK